MSLTGRGTLGVVRDGSGTLGRSEPGRGTLWEVRPESGDPTRGLGRVGKRSWWFGTVKWIHP